MAKKQEYCVVDFDMDCLAYFTVTTSYKKAVENYVKECTKDLDFTAHNIMVFQTKNRKDFEVTQKTTNPEPVVNLTITEFKHENNT